jgi:hypothetical protein
MEDWVMKCDKEIGKGRLGDEVWQRERSFSFLFAIIYHPVFPFLSLCHTPSPNLLFPFSWERKWGKEKGKRRLGDGE